MVYLFRYNDKELDSKNGLNWYDYGARHYDATLGRWHVVDPSAENYYGVTPYSYCESNPINRIDPTGTDWIQDSYGYYLWDDNAKDQETTRNGWTYVGKKYLMELIVTGFLKKLMDSYIIRIQTIF